MAINALSYIGVNSDKLEDWADYSEKSLGMQMIDRGKGSLSFRMDDQKQRLAITGDTGDSLAFVGWEVEKKDDLQGYAAKLEKNNIPVTLGDSSYSDKRFVDELIYFNDPQGNRIELIYSPMKDKDSFKPSRPISGFKTGALGMGHVVGKLRASSYARIIEIKGDDYFVESPINKVYGWLNSKHIKTIVKKNYKTLSLCN